MSCCLFLTGKNKKASFFVLLSAYTIFVSRSVINHIYMLKFLITVFFLVFILLSLLGFSVIRSFKSFFFGSPKGHNKRRTATNQRASRTKNTTAQRPSRKKVISDDEGEYVDYEEVKD